VVINKTNAALRSTVSLAGMTPSGPADVYTYTGVNLHAIVHGADQAVTTSGFTRTFPASSITLLAIPT
jgi:hypothetical protein